MNKYEVKVEFWSRFDPNTNRFDAHRTLHWETYHVTAKDEVDAIFEADDKALEDSTADIMERFTVGIPRLIKGT